MSTVFLFPHDQCLWKNNASSPTSIRIISRRGWTCRCNHTRSNYIQRCRGRYYFLFIHCTLKKRHYEDVFILFSLHLLYIQILNELKFSRIERTDKVPQANAVRIQLPMKNYQVCFRYENFPNAKCRGFYWNPYFTVDLLDFVIVIIVNY